MAEQKTYVPASGGTEKPGTYGPFFSLYFKADELIKFAQEHQNEGGWLKLTMSKRREEGKKGETHSIYLDTWKPNVQAQDGTRTNPARPRTETPPDENSTVPF